MLLFAIILFIALIYVVRKLLFMWMNSKPSVDIDPLESLRRVRDAGEMSPDEFDAARKRIIEQTKAKLS